MNNYTVLLLRPDYIASEFGKDTYLAHVVANGVEAAQRVAQDEVILSDNEGCSFEEIEEAGGLPEDYHVLFVAMGHLQDLTQR